MGNLYTHIETKHDKRIATLSELKQAYGNTPRDWKLIYELKNKLHQLEKPIKPISLKKKYGMFAHAVKKDL